MRKKWKIKKKFKKKRLKHNYNNKKIEIEPIKK